MFDSFFIYTGLPGKRKFWITLDQQAMIFISLRRSAQVVSELQETPTKQNLIQCWLSFVFST